jgi:hypothetical protein
MTLEEIAEKAIPFAKKECEIGKGIKLKARKQLIDRIKAWYQEQMTPTIVQHDQT